MKIIGVNGINTHGAGNTDVMLAELQKLGYDVLDVHLPKRHFITARWGAAKDAEAIHQFAEDGDVIVAHSFGCLRAAKAMEIARSEGLKYSTVFMFRPAMSRHYRFNGLARDTDVYCFFSYDDIPIMIGSWLIGHPFGAAGRAGFSDPSVINMRSAGDHNADFDARLQRNVEFIDYVLQDKGIPCLNF